MRTMLLASLAALVTLTQVCAGQMVTTVRSSGVGAMAAVSRRSVDAYASLLHFDDDQLDVALALHEGYTESHHAHVRAMQEDMQALQEEFRESHDASIFMEKMPELMKEHGDRIGDNEQRFFADLQLLLREDQREDWPRIERHRRRETQLLGGGFLSVSGANVDLFKVVSNAKLEDSSMDAAQEQLRRYEVEFDRAIASRAEVQQEMFGGTNRMDFGDMEAFSRMMDDIREKSLEMKAINERYERLIGSELPESDARTFHQSFLEAAYPRVFRPSHAERCLEAAEGFSDLTADQRTAITELHGAHVLKASRLNRAWMEAIEKEEAEAQDQGGMFGGNMVMFMPGDEEKAETPRGKARADRTALDDDSLSRLREILTDDQHARLPEKPAAPQSMQFETIEIRG